MQRQENEVKTSSKKRKLSLMIIWGNGIRDPFQKWKLEVIFQLFLITKVLISIDFQIENLSSFLSGAFCSCLTWVISLSSCSREMLLRFSSVQTLTFSIRAQSSSRSRQKPMLLMIPFKAFVPVCFPTTRLRFPPTISGRKSS